MINTPELIKLAKQAGYGTQITLFMDGQREDIWGGSNETQKLEKFAELIVKECAKAAYKYTDDSKNYEHYDDIGWDCLPGDLQSHIKEHFGVEE